jgi:hypothetical protein
VSGQLKPRPQPQVAEEDEEEDEEPALVCNDLPNFKSVLEASDVLLHVVDARDPLEYRSVDLEDVAKERGMKVVFVLNKIGASSPPSYLPHLLMAVLSRSLPKGSRLRMGISPPDVPSYLPVQVVVCIPSPVV